MSRWWWSSTVERSRRVERAIAALRGGRAVRVGGSASLLSVETATEAMLAPGRPGRRGGAADQRPAGGGAWARQPARGGRSRAGRCGWRAATGSTARRSQAIADPGRDFDRASRSGRWRSSRSMTSRVRGRRAAPGAARRAAPGVVAGRGRRTLPAAEVAPDDVARPARGATIVARARLPLDGLGRGPDRRLPRSRRRARSMSRCWSARRAASRRWSACTANA